MTSQAANITGSWVTGGYTDQVGPETQGTGTASAGTTGFVKQDGTTISGTVYEFDLLKNGSTWTHPGATESYLYFVPGTTVDNGIMYDTASDVAYTMSGSGSTYQADSAGTQVGAGSVIVNIQSIFVNGVVPTAAPSSPWIVTTTSTPATGTASHNYVQDSLRNITCSKTAAYQHKWTFTHADVSSGNWHASMGKNAVCYTCKHWPGGGSTSTDIVSQCFDQADGDYSITITSNTTFPNSQIVTGDVSTLHADIDMQISDGVGGWTWILAGDIIASFTYEATNVVFTVGAGYVGDTVAIIATDTNQYPDYDNTISFSYTLDNPPSGHQGSAGQMTASILNATGPHTLESTNNHTLSGTWVVGDDGSSSPTGLEGTLYCWRKTPAPQQLQSVVMSRAFVLPTPVGQNPNNRRRAHSFW